MAKLLSHETNEHENLKEDKKKKILSNVFLE